MGGMATFKEAAISGVATFNGETKNTPQTRLPLEKRKHSRADVLEHVKSTSHDSHVHMD